MLYAIGDRLFDPDYLEHHGILGQKWGIRRYQNADGTLTEEGKKRYGIGLANGEEDAKKLAKLHKDNYFNGPLNRKGRKLLGKDAQERLKKIAAADLRAAQIDQEIVDDKDFLKVWHEEHDKMYDTIDEETREYYEEEAAKWNKRYPDDPRTARDVFNDGTDYSEEVAKKVAERYGKKNEYDDAISARERGISDYINNIGTGYGDMLDLSAYLSSMAAATEYNKGDPENYKKASELIEKYAGIKVDGKKFLSEIRRQAYNDREDYKRAKAYEEFDKKIHIDWDKKDKSYDDLKKAWWDTMAIPGMPAGDNGRNSFRREMYKRSGRPDSYNKDANGENFKKAVKEIERLNDEFKRKEKSGQLDGGKWASAYSELADKEDELLAEAIARDMGYKPTEETINFFKDILYED